MVDEARRFRWRKDRTLTQAVSYDKAVRECRAQLERCRDLLGRIPDARSAGGFHNPLSKAIETVCDEYGTAHNFLQGIDYNGKRIICKEEYLGKHLYEITLKDNSHIESLKVKGFPFYHPMGAMMVTPAEEDKIAMFSRYPGFLDDYVLTESSCTLPRVKDVEALCDERVIQWITDNRIELANYRDTLYGTSEYQEHLKETDSPLYLEEQRRREMSDVTWLNENQILKLVQCINDSEESLTCSDCTTLLGTNVSTLKKQLQQLRPVFEKSGSKTQGKTGHDNGLTVVIEGTDRYWKYHNEIPPQ